MQSLFIQCYNALKPCNDSENDFHDLSPQAQTFGAPADERYSRDHRVREGTCCIFRGVVISTRSPLPVDRDRMACLRETMHYAT
jgi:hypothetical protein